MESELLSHFTVNMSGRSMNSIDQHKEHKEGCVPKCFEIIIFRNLPSASFPRTLGYLHPLLYVSRWYGDVSFVTNILMLPRFGSLKTIAGGGENIGPKQGG